MISEALPKPVTQINFLCKINGWAFGLGAAFRHTFEDRPAQIQGVPKSAAVPAARLLSQPALFAKKCSHSCNTDLVCLFESPKKLIFGIDYLYLCENKISIYLARTCYSPKQQTSFGSIFQSFKGFWVRMSATVFFSLPFSNFSLHTLNLKPSTLNSKT